MTHDPRGGGRHVLLSLLTVPIHRAPRMFQEVRTGLRREDPACRARRAPWRNEPDRRWDRRRDRPICPLASQPSWLCVAGPGPTSAADGRTPASRSEPWLHLHVGGWGLPSPPPRAGYGHSLGASHSPSSAQPHRRGGRPSLWFPPGVLSRARSGDRAPCLASVPPSNDINLRTGAHAHFHSPALPHNSTHFVAVFSPLEESGKCDVDVDKRSWTSPQASVAHPSARVLGHSALRGSAARACP